MADGRQHDLLLQKPEKNLPCALQLGELAEDQGERILHSKVWILFYLIKPFANIANRHCREQLASPGFLFERFMGALA